MKISSIILFVTAVAAVPQFRGRGGLARGKLSGLGKSRGGGLSGLLGGGKGSTGSTGSSGGLAGLAALFGGAAPAAAV